MKKIYNLILLVFCFSSCEEFVQCKSLHSSEITMLMDISDEVLFSEIHTDFKRNFPDFIKHTSIANLNECEEAKLTLASLSGKDELLKLSKTLKINDKGLSKKELHKRANPAEIVKMLKDYLIDCEKMSKNKLYNSSTRISQTFVKSILELDENYENTIIIFSDMVILNRPEGVDFYEKVPKNVELTVEKLISTDLRKKLNVKLQNGLKVRIVIVLKEEPKGIVSKRKVKEFWLNAFSYLGFQDVQVIDNLSQRILWD